MLAVLASVAEPPAAPGGSARRLLFASRGVFVAGQDGLAERNLGRVQARRIVGEAKGSLARLLASLRATLPEPP